MAKFINLRGLLFVVLSSIAFPVFAETSIAVMNYQAVLFNSKAASDATVKLRVDLEPQQKRLRDIQQQIETRQGRLQTDKDILTPEEIEQFQREIQALAAEQQQTSALMQRAQQQSRDQFIKQYQPIIRDLVSAYVDENGYSIVIDSQAVLWNKGEPDITEQIIEQFDAEYAEQNKSSLTSEE